MNTNEKTEITNESYLKEYDKLQKIAEQKTEEAFTKYSALESKGHDGMLASEVGKINRWFFTEAGKLKKKYNI